MSDSIDDDVNKISNANDHVDDIVESNVVNNNVVKENAMSNNGNNVVNKNTIKNNVENNNVVINNVVGKIVVEFSSVENSALAENNTMEKRNYSPVTVSENIVNPGSSSLCAFSQGSGDGNLVEPSSSVLFSSGASDVVMEGASDSRKRAHSEVSSDGDSVDIASCKSKPPVCK